MSSERERAETILAAAGIAPDDESTRGDKEFWDHAKGLTAIRDWARARRAGPYSLLGEVLLQVAARIPPQVVLPPLGAGQGTQGTASLNQLYASVGPPGLSKGLGHQLAAEIIAWPGGVPAPVYAPMGSGEGIAATYVACQRDENKQFVMTQLAWSAIFAATEIDRLAGLLGRKSATLAGVLRSMWSGEPLGEANASEDRRRHVQRHGYRAGVMVHVQPGRGGVLLNSDEAAAGTPQRILWLPAVDPEIPDVAPEPPEPLTWAVPGEIRYALDDLDRLSDQDQLIQLGSLGLVVMPVCQAAREAIDRAAVARHRGETGALDGHALLVREKLAAVLGAFLGRFGVTDDDWELAGHLMEVSSRAREYVSAELHAAAEKENNARARSEAARARIVNDTLEADKIQKAAVKIIDTLRDSGGENDGWITGAALRRAITPGLRDSLDDALRALQRAGSIEDRRTERGTGGHGGVGREYRLTDARTTVTPAQMLPMGTVPTPARMPQRRRNDPT